MPAQWHEFYALLGTAAAALVALLFVALSIGASVLTPERAGATRTFMSPIVFHYTAVLFASLIALVPTQTLQSLGLSIGLVALAGTVYASGILIRVVRDDLADMADNFGYGGIPVAAYVGCLIAAGYLIAGSLAGPSILAGALLLLLIINIRNAWDTTLALARRHAGEINRKNGAPTNQGPPP
jgi:hypothetical protein